jgi:hypothetical protein
MSAKLVFAVGVLGVGGYYGFQMSKFDPTVFPYSKEQVQSLLTEAKTSTPRKDGHGEILIWSTGLSEKGVGLAEGYVDGAPFASCEAVITAIAPDKSRVVADCSGDQPQSRPSDPSTGSGSTNSADNPVASTEVQLRAPIFEEHIQATLNHRAFDRSTVDNREAGIVLRNVPAMQGEALRRAAEAARRDAEAHR